MEYEIYLNKYIKIYELQKIFFVVNGKEISILIIFVDNCGYSSLFPV